MAVRLNKKEIKLIKKKFLHLNKKLRRKID